MADSNNNACEAQESSVYEGKWTLVDEDANDDSWKNDIYEIQKVWKDDMYGIREDELDTVYIYSKDASQEIKILGGA